MNETKYSLENYKKFLLNRCSTTQHLCDTIENLISTDDDAIPYCFHKIMIHNWSGDLDILFDIMSDFFNITLVPVNVLKQCDITSFYTSNLNLIYKLMKQDFLMPLQRFMYNVDILLNDKKSEELFNAHITLDDVISNVVSSRFTPLTVKGELDLSNFCGDEEFINKNIYFYRISLLSHFKLPMLRVGRDTRSLNLSHNKLTHPPLDVMNFFIKGDLVEVNLSHNSISSISDLVRVSSKIEKLWLEGNPLCEDSEPSAYVKQLLVKFPRLVQLDGIKISEGVQNRNFMSDTSRSTQTIVNTFLSLYFSHYDSASRQLIEGFYDDYSTLSIAHSFTWKAISKYKLDRYLLYGRNFMSNNMDKSRVYNNKQQVVGVHKALPDTTHDPFSFTVDVIKHDKNLMVIVDGIFKEKNVEHAPQTFRFRRTFYLVGYEMGDSTAYHIRHEMFNIELPTDEQIQHSFRYPIRDLTSLSLMSPSREACEDIIRMFSYITLLKKEQAETRLQVHGWDIRKALQHMVADVMNDKVPMDAFVEEDNFSDTSLLDDEMVD